MCFPFDMTAASRTPTSLDDPPQFPRKQCVVLECGMDQKVVRVMNSGSMKSTASHSERCMTPGSRENTLPTALMGNINEPSDGCLMLSILTLPHL